MNSKRENGGVDAKILLFHFLAKSEARACQGQAGIAVIRLLPPYELPTAFASIA